MGGMTAPAMLGRPGFRVLVLEQHFGPGGFTQTFRRGPYTWDIGVDAVGEVTTDTPTGRLLDDLTQARLAWASLGAMYDRFQFPDDVHLDFPDSKDGFESLLSIEPRDRRAIHSRLRV